MLCASLGKLGFFWSWWVGSSANIELDLHHSVPFPQCGRYVRSKPSREGGIVGVLLYSGNPQLAKQLYPASES